MNGPHSEANILPERDEGERREAALAALLLEDSRFDAELIGETLRASYPLATLTHVSDEASFQQVLANGRFDVILSDYDLPGFSGLQALEHARTAAPRTPFIFVSGVIGEENAVEMLKRGATDYVSKSRLARLPVVVDRALREAGDRAAREIAESRLREADAIFARVVDSLRDYAVILLDPQGRIRSWNRAARDIFGYDATQVIGRDGALLLTPEERDAEVFGAELQRALVHGKSNDDRWLARADGERLWAESVTVPLHSDVNRHTGFCKIVRDSTAAKAHEEALRSAKDDAERANRAKDRFLAVLSHELRTPLAPIAAAAQVLERAAAVPDKFRGLLPMIQRNVALEARLIEDLLDLTAISAGKLTLKRAPVDMHQLVRAVVEMVGEQIAEKKLEVVLDLTARRARVEADAARMQQVLWNVVRNAIKFTPEGGRIRIATTADDDVFTLRCSDSGIGIEAAALDRIFIAFEQADPEVSRRFGGLGLGMAIARGLVTEHGGELFAQSEGRGRGATFVLRLALLGGEDAPADTAGARPVRRADDGCRVLLVEDNRDAADAMLLSLEGYGYRVTHVTTRAEALARARDEAFDVVVTDLGLPDGSGIEIGRALSAALPVIALSGYGAAEDLQRSALAGFSGHLVKPADPAAVHALVQGVLAGRR